MEYVIFVHIPVTYHIHPYIIYQHVSSIISRVWIFPALSSNGEFQRSPNALAACVNSKVFFALETLSYDFPRIPTTIKAMGVNITTIAYLRDLVIEIGSTINFMVVEAQGFHGPILQISWIQPFSKQKYLKILNQKQWKPPKVTTFGSRKKSKWMLWFLFFDVSPFPKGEVSSGSSR